MGDHQSGTQGVGGGNAPSGSAQREQQTARAAVPGRTAIRIDASIKDVSQTVKLGRLHHPAVGHTRTGRCAVAAVNKLLYG